MKCWNSAFKHKVRESYYNSRVRVGAVKIYVAAVQALRKKGNTRWNSVYHQNFAGKTSLGPNYFLFKKKVHSQLRIWCHVMLKLTVSPPNCLTLWITLINKRKGFWYPEFCLCGWEAFSSCEFIFLFKFDYFRR
jgi:hypothetical protein